ncbi:MAG TPA: hypothetical protein VI756_02225 [Blastocatellia bacterium]
MSSNATGKVCPKRSKRKSRNRQKKSKKKRDRILTSQAAIPARGAQAKSIVPALTGPFDEWPLYMDTGTYGRVPVPKPQPKPEPAIPPPVRLSTNSVCPLCKDMGQLNWHGTADGPAILIYCLCPIGAKVLAQALNEIQRLGAPPLPPDRYYAEIQFEPIPDEPG